jgi:hypothetical protein
MDNNTLFYKPSGQMSSNGSIFTILLNLLFAFIAGFLYSTIIYYNPFVYVNFLLTIGFGLSVGLLNRLMIRVGHNRNKKDQLILAGAGGFMALYIHWASFMLIIDYQGVPSLGNYFANVWYFINPVNFFHAMGVINKFGLWSIFGITFKGFGLALFWLFEAFIILFLSVSAVYKANILPYSEKFGMWYPKFTLYNDFQSVSAAKAVTEELAKTPYEFINNLAKGWGNRHAKIHIYYLKEELQQYLSIENIFMEGQGRGKTNKTMMISNFRISNETAKKILENYKHKKERIDLI